MENLSTKQKVVAGLGLAATAVAAALALNWASKRSTTTSNRRTSTKEEVETVQKEFDNEEMARNLKDEGNAAFKEKQYKKAIEYYTRAAEICTKEKWIYYGNRSVAHLNMKDYESAFNDAKLCIELNPLWAKGHFRAGRALVEKGDYQNGFKYLFRACDLEPSQEAKSSLQSAKEKISPNISVRDSENITRNLNQKKQTDSFAAKCGTTPEHIYELVKSYNGEKFLERADVQQMREKDEASFLKVVSMAIFTQELAGARYSPLNVEIREAISKRHNNDAELRSSVAILCALSAQLEEAVTNLKKAAELSDFSNATIVHDWLSFVKLKVQNSGDQNSLDGLTLDMLSKSFECPEVNTPTVAEMIIPTWLNSFGEPALINQIQQVESEKNGKSEEQVLRLDLESISEGRLNEQVTQKAFIRSLSDCVISNVGIEKILSGYRHAVLLYAEYNAGFHKIKELLYAIALQLYLNSWSWSNSPKEFEEVDHAVRQLEDRIEHADPNSLVREDGTIDKTFLVKLIAVSLYVPLWSIKGLTPLIQRANLTLLHPPCAHLFKNTVLNHEHEIKLANELVPVTTVDRDSSAFMFRDQMVFKHWEHPGPYRNGGLKINPVQHLAALFPQEDFSSLASADKLNVLMTSIGSGQNAYKYHISHEAVKLTGLELSPKNVSFAIRQVSDLNEQIRFVQGDATHLTHDSFGAESFDLIVEKELSYYPAPVETLKSLSSVLKPNGIIKVTAQRQDYVSYIGRFRKIFKSTSPSLFGSAPLYAPARFPTNQELNELRAKLFFDESQTPSEEDLQMVLMNLPFTIPDFYSVYFQPNQTGYSFSSLAKTIEDAGLEFLGFELSQLQTADVLGYEVLYPEDINMKDGNNMDEFYAKHARYPNYEITAVARKKAN